MTEDSRNEPDKRMESEAAAYIEKHKIMEFFDNLTAELVYYRPDDPKAYARDFIQKLQKAHSDSDIDPPCLIDQSNLESIFGMLDITNTGYITCEQYLKAMSNLGVKNFNTTPLGGEFNRITCETFIREAKSGARKVSAT